MMSMCNILIVCLLFAAMPLLAEVDSSPMLTGLNDNMIVPLKDGAQLMAKREELVNKAQRSIYLSTFSISPDQIGKDIFKVLCSKAKAGLDVRLVIDHRANKDYMDYALKLKDCKAQVILFRPGSRFYAIHEKLLIIDGETLIMGGSGYSRTYKLHAFDSYREERLKQEKINHGWYDVDYHVTGLAACSLHYQFQLNFKRLALMVADYNPDIWWYGWDNFVSMREEYYALKKMRPCNPDVHEKKYGTSKAVGILGNPYVTNARPILKNHLSAIQEAIEFTKQGNKKEITLYAPYFIPGGKFVAALVAAHKAGVKVRVLTNSLKSTDEKAYGQILFAAMIYAIKPLLNAGIEVRMWNEKSTLHRKGGVIGDVVFFGSDNLDNRAQEYQSESVIYTDDVVIVDDMKKDFERDVLHSDPLDAKFVKQFMASTSALYKWVGRNFKKYF
ncbi:MAG: phosphatidylserine/phosphatidylglycerophosphate/cardiolipin synthase family protein [Bdellovibrio sp.]|nr:phosphatidylserine/phosphatidylglycerophosphate/cardiolipin synthase family protein [Bdellovibrio sp.]